MIVVVRCIYRDSNDIYLGNMSLITYKPTGVRSFVIMRVIQKINKQEPFQNQK